MISIRFPRSPAILVLLLALVYGCDQPAGQPPGRATGSADAAADRVLTNGEILTVDAELRIAQAIAIRGERVLAVGTNEEMLATAGPGTEVMDLAGRTVIPGLIDNHMHFVRAAQQWYRHVRWDGVTSRARALELIAEKARALPEGEWVVVIGGWNFAQFGDDSRLFTLEELDAACPDRPLYIQEGYRRAFANSRALVAAGLEPSGNFQGRDVRRAPGEPMGGAVGQVLQSIPAVSDEVWDASLRRMATDLHRLGLTTVYDPGGNTVTSYHYEVIERAAESGDLSMRVFYSLNMQNGVGSSAEEIIDALRTRTPDLTGLRTAQFGYGETTYRPMRAEPWQISREDLDRYRSIALVAAERGWQLNEHSFRDEKIRAMLSVFEAVDEIRPIAGLRWTIAHNNAISAASVQRAIDLGMVFAVHSGRRLVTPETLATEGAAGLRRPPIRTIDALGGVWGLGSDSTTVASPNPFHNIGWAVSGLSPGGETILEETVSREAALTAHTRTNAYLLFREDDLGSLEPGKLADLAVLDGDYLSVPAEEIEHLRSVLTLVGGAVVYSEL